MARRGVGDGHMTLTQRQSAQILKKTFLSRTDRIHLFTKRDAQHLAAVLGYFLACRKEA